MMTLQRFIRAITLCTLVSVGSSSIVIPIKGVLSPLADMAALGGVAGVVQVIAQKFPSTNNSMREFGYLTILNRLYQHESLLPHHGTFKAWTKTWRDILDRHMGTSTGVFVLRAVCYYVVEHLLHTYEGAQRTFIGGFIPSSAYSHTATMALRELCVLPTLLALGNVCLPEAYVTELMAVAPIARVWLEMLYSKK